jgi:hypothetical protein
VSPVKYEMGFYIPEDGILHSHRRGNLKSYTISFPVCVSFYICSSTSAFLISSEDFETRETTLLCVSPSFLFL